MKRIVRAYAKINETLAVGKKARSGLHLIKSVMTPIDLHDTLTFQTNRRGIVSFSCSDKKLSGAGNLVVRAAMAMKAYAAPDDGVSIHLQKNIPVGAGLGGGSSDAAATLLTLIKLWGVQVSKKKLLAIAHALGSDVPFFIVGKRAVVSGTGERINVLPKKRSRFLVIINPGFPISTKEAYALLDKSRKRKPIRRHPTNDFLPALAPRYPRVQSMLSDLLHSGATLASLSGSGPTTFGLFRSEKDARKAARVLSGKYPFVLATRSR